MHRRQYSSTEQLALPAMPAHTAWPYPRECEPSVHVVPFEFTVRKKKNVLFCNQDVPGFPFCEKVLLLSYVFCLPLRRKSPSLHYQQLK